MSEGNSGVSPQDNPPSFIPSGTRKRRPSGQVPRPSAAGEAVPGAGPQAGVPSRRQTSAGAQGAQSMPAAQDVIPSFTPNSSRRVSGSTRRSASEQDARLQPVSPMQDAASAARRQPRRAAGSTHTISNQPRPGEGAGAQSMFASAQRQGPQSPYGYGMPAAQGGGRGMSGRPAATAMRRKRPVGRIVASVLAALLVVIMLVTFGLWNWVDGHLDKQPWLSDKANTSGTSWLILGSDQRTGEEAKTITGFRTDTILVLTKPNSGTRSLISIPRDSLVQVNGTYMKINAVDLCYDQTVNDALSNLNWTAGCHTADGATALAFSRMRYSDPKGDFGRAERQRQVIGAIAKKAMSGKTLTNIPKLNKTLKAALASITVDSKTNPYTLAQMVFAFRDATSDNGISGSVYWTNPGYNVSGVGSSVLLDDAKNLELFRELASGSHKPGAVGTLANQ